MLRNGNVNFCNYEGYPILDNGELEIDDGKNVLEVPGPTGDKILYREDSFDKLFDNDSIRYEKGMKSFIDQHQDLSINHIHGLIISKKQCYTRP